MATDYGPAMVNSARKTLAPFDGRAGASQADATALPFEDQRFDLVLSCGMLHHVGDDEAGGLVGAFAVLLLPQCAFAARLSSMLMMAGQSSLITASSPGKCPRALVTLRSW